MPQSLRAQDGKPVRVHSYGAAYVIKNPKVQQDTLIGSSLRIALEDLNAAQVRKFSWEKTTLLALGILMRDWHGRRRWC